MNGHAANPEIRQIIDYRHDIDGLRAVAVLSVVLYHAGLPWIPGGYIGVDVFFVISGYLIINQIMSARRKGRFSYSEFWSRRALRILPPYLLVILTCALLAPFVLVMPGEYMAFAVEAGFSAIMLANHLFLSQQGYFDAGSDTKVLLHLWSLAVEEQFYIAAPLIIGALWFLRARMFAVAAVLLFSASLAACIYWNGDHGDRNFSFFVMPLRAWEFIAGGAVAAVAPLAARLPRAFINVVATLGLGAVLYAATAFTKETSFPSYWATVPVFGTCAVIMAGAAGTNVISAALAIRPMVAIGLISYSWYLWHWPLLVFGRIYNFGDRVPSVDFAMVLLSAALAIATYLLLERPIRRAREVRRRPLGWRPTLAGLAACLIAGGAAYQAFITKAKYVEASLAGSMLPHPPGSALECDLARAQQLDPCLAKNEGRSLGVLIGDSQSAAATRGMVDLASRRNSGLMAVASGGCISFMPPKTNIPDSRMAENCRKYRENTRRLLDGVKVNYAILYSYWTLYSNDTPHYYFVDENSLRVSDQRSAFIDGFHETLAYLRSLGVARILVVGPTPTFPRLAPECTVRAIHYGIDPDARCSQPTTDEMVRRGQVIEWLNTAISADDSVRMIDPIEVLCDERYCRAYQDNRVLFNDTNHISDAGVEVLAENFSETFDWLIR